jgi:hemerythrin-like domain-containing protein
MNAIIYVRIGSLGGMVMEEILKQILSELKEMKSNIHDIKVDIGDLKQGQGRLEVGQEKLQKNLVDSLGAYTEKIVEHVDDKTEVLNKRVFKVESDIERLSRQ